MIDEIWREAPNWPLYEVSNLGRVRRADTKKLMAACVHRQTGYPRACLSNGATGSAESVTVHSLVCAAFHGQRPSPKHQVAHKDGSRDNNRSDNLRWATVAENHADKQRHGTKQCGERAGTSKLTAEAVREIRRRYQAGIDAARSQGKIRAPRGLLPSLAAEFGVTYGGIRNVLPSGNAWKHIT